MQKARIFWMQASLMFIVTLGLLVCGWTSTSSVEAATVEITDVTVERLNEIAEEDYRGTDVLVFQTTFNFMNKSDELAEIRNCSFTVRVDDGTDEKTIVQTTSMPTTYIPGNKEITWSYTAPLLYGGLIGSYVTRGLGEGGIPGAVGKLNEIWEAMGKDEKAFYIDGRYSTSYPDRPEAGKVQQFSFEYEVPEL